MVGMCDTSSKDILYSNLYCVSTWVVKVGAPYLRIVAKGNGSTVNFDVVGELRSTA